MSDSELVPALQRQLRRLKMSADDPPDAAGWAEFLRSVNATYLDNRQDLYLMERSLRMVSREMQELYQRLEQSAESRLAAERDRLEAIISGVSDAFVSMDTDCRFMTLNPAAQHMLGGDAVGGFLTDYLTLPRTAQGDNALSVVATRLRNGEVIRCEDASASRPGLPPVPVSVLLFPIRQGGQITSFGMMARDISQRLESERSLVRLARAVDASADAIYTTDIDGTIEYVNAAFTAITGWSADEAIGSNPRILRSPHSSPDTHQQMWAVLKAGQVWSSRIQNRRRVPPGTGDGGSGRVEYWAQSTIAPYFDATGQLLGFVALQRDITQEVMREQSQAADAAAIELRAEVAAALQESGPLSRVMTTVVDRVCAVISDCTDQPCAAVLRLLAVDGADAADVTGHASMPAGWRQVVAHRPSGGAGMELIAWPDRVSHAEQDRGLVVVGISHGDDLIGSLVLAARIEPGLPAPVLESLMLISDMIGLAVGEDRALQAAEAARLVATEAAEAKSAFLANMSHEIRTPMNGVLGMLDVLRHTELTAQQGDYVMLAHRSAESLLTVINDILDLSKIEAGKIDFEEIPFDVRSVVEDIASLLGAAAHSKGVQLACFVPAGIPVDVRGDPTRLRQVLSNVIGNAVKFTENGEIIVRVTVPDPAPADLSPDRVALRFEVVDTGIGMSQEALQALFEPFVQADSSTTRRFGGTGLGLAIARQLVELMGGEIGALSSLGQGTRIWFDLPLLTSSSDQLVDTEAAGFPGARVLLVDDNQTNRMIMGQYFSSWDVDWDLADDGQRVLEMVREAIGCARPYSVVMLDMDVLGMDALGLAGQLKQDPALPDVRLAVVATGGMSEEVMRAHKFDYLVAKPVRQSVVRSMFQDIVRGGRASSGARHTAERLRRLSGRVLLVEDNLFNQRVALEMLGMLGVTADLAGDGRQALARLAKTPVDLVLMDCQMPVLDGFEATRQLRRMSTTWARVPVIAMTANAMAGDREACIEAGMDDYLAKPFSVVQLSAVLRRWLPEQDSTADAGPSVPSGRSRHVEETVSAPGSAINADTLDELASAMDDSFVEVVELYVERASILLESLADSLAEHDRQQVRIAAHTLKGSSGLVGAEHLSQLAGSIEAADGDVPLEGLVGAVVAEFGRVEAALRELVPGLAARPQGE